MFLGLDLWQSVLLIFMILLCINYLSILAMERLTTHTIDEGFETMSESTRQETLVNDELYDDFYASVYNKIFQHDKLVQAEAAIALHEWTKDTKAVDMRVLDLCCGTGVATCYFAQEGVSKVIGVDKSPAMIRFAKNSVVPKTTLKESQLEAIEWKQADVYSPSICEPSSISHACLLYFTVYHFRDIDAIFRNLALWVRPGGHMVIEVVNKYKFEPIPDVANPWAGTSPQKYTKERITDAKAAFDKFDYDSHFELEDPRAEFQETFRFKDGTTRKQKHVLWMPSIEQIVQKASQTGWVYDKFTSLDMIGFQYGYLLFFIRSLNP